MPGNRLAIQRARAAKQNTLAQAGFGGQNKPSALAQAGRFPGADTTRPSDNYFESQKDAPLRNGGVVPLNDFERVPEDTVQGDIAQFSDAPPPSTTGDARSLRERTIEGWGLDPNLDRSALLPWARDAEGNLVYSMPELGIEIGNAFNLLPHAMEGGEVYPRDTAEFTGVFTGGSFAAPRPAGALGMGGRTPKTPPPSGPTAPPSNKPRDRLPQVLGVDADTMTQRLGKDTHQGLVTGYNTWVNHLTPTQLKAHGVSKKELRADPARGAEIAAGMRGDPRAQAFTEAFEQARTDLAPPPAGPLKITGGLSFPAEGDKGYLHRLRLREKRAADTAAGKTPPGLPKNERTVIPAPEGSGLPDFVVGRITFDDWIARTEAVMTDADVTAATKWYDEIRGVFDKYTGADAALTDMYMRAWLVTQQNVSVSNAMNNVLLQAEQFARGVDPAQMKAGGMPNPTGAARAVLQGEPIERGVGQKIADFVDSGEGKDVRAWMGNDPKGGSPFVIDIHSARDTGLVDATLLNHLERRGYRPRDLNLETDFKDAIHETQYESRADFGRALTQHLNDIGWKGRRDWKPREVQAVGWQSMTKLTDDKMEDVVTGLEGVHRRLSYELAPGEGSPWETQFGERWHALPMDTQTAITKTVAGRAIDIAQEVSGIDVRNIVHGTGGWDGGQNPAVVAQALSTMHGAEIAANALGYMLQQTEVWVNSIKGVTKKPKALAVDIISSGKELTDDATLKKLWGAIVEADKEGLFGGYQPIMTPDSENGIRIVLEKVKNETKKHPGTKKQLDEFLDGALMQVLEDQGFDFDVRGYEASVVIARNDWKETPDGQGYLARLAELGGRSPAAGWDNVRQELTDTFEAELRRAEAGPTGPAGAAQQQLDDIHKATVLSRTAGGLGPEHGGDFAGFTPRSYNRRDTRAAQAAVAQTGAARNAPVDAVHETTSEAAHLFEKAGLSAPAFLELAPGAPNSLGAFVKAITAAKKANNYGAAVGVPSPEVLADAKLVMTPDGMSGFAVYDDNVIGFFNNPKGPHEDVGVAMAQLATAMGGRRLTTLDTTTPGLYSRAGYRVVARVPWDDARAPEGWDQSTFKAFNNGRPDTVFMVFDPARGNVPGTATPDVYKRGEGQMAATYDEAVNLQRQALAALNPSVRGFQGGHTIYDRPDNTKILSGTGVTAEAYGHYLGEVRQTGEEYAKAMWGKDGATPVVTELGVGPTKARFIDFEAPLSEQPPLVRKGIMAVLEEHGEDVAAIVKADPPGKNFVSPGHNTADMYGDKYQDTQKMMAKSLLDNGVAGVRYQDSVSARQPKKMIRVPGHDEPMRAGDAANLEWKAYRDELGLKGRELDVAKNAFRTAFEDAVLDRNFIERGNVVAAPRELTMQHYEGAKKWMERFGIKAEDSKTTYNYVVFDENDLAKLGHEVLKGPAD